MKLWKQAAIAAAATGATYAAQRYGRKVLAHRRENQKPVPAVNGSANYRSTPSRHNQPQANTAH